MAEDCVVESILLILPPKSLMRFKCVSTWWYALINTPKFIADHLSNSISMHHNNNNNNLSTTTSTTITRVVLMKPLVPKDVDDPQHVGEARSHIKKMTENIEDERFSMLTFRCDVDNDGHCTLATHEDVTLPLTPPTTTSSSSSSSSSSSLCIIGHCNGIICLARRTSNNYCEVLLWNPSVEKEIKTLPTMPYVPDDPRHFEEDDDDAVQYCSDETGLVYAGRGPGAWCRFKDMLGFGYCPNSNDYKVVNINNDFGAFETGENNLYHLYHPAKAAVYNLSNDSWRASLKSPYSLETETSIIWTEKFCMYFKGMCFWTGIEQNKEIDSLEWMEAEIIRLIIILFHMEDEVFHAVPLPLPLNVNYAVFILLVWNNSVAILAHQYDEQVCFGIWVLDDEAGLFKGCAWTKLYTIDIDSKNDIDSKKMMGFLKSDQILMWDDENETLLSYNLVTNNDVKYLMDLRVSNDSSNVIYLHSLVSLSEGGNNRFNTRDYSKHEFPRLKYSPFHHSPLLEAEWYSYSLWAFPQNDVSARIKKIMNGLRSEFPSPEIEPHIPIIGGIQMAHDQVLNASKSFHSWLTYSYIVKVDDVAIRDFYFQCVSLLFDSKIDFYPPSKLSYDFASELAITFGIPTDVCFRPHLSLLYGNFTKEENKRAQEKVHILDGSITSLSFPITRLALYKINYRNPTLNEKIAEYPLLQRPSS